MSSKWLQTITMTTGPSLCLIVEENTVTVTAILEQKRKPHAARVPEVSAASSCEFQRVLLSQTSQNIANAQASCTYHLKQVCDPLQNAPALSYTEAKQWTIGCYWECSTNEVVKCFGWTENTSVCRYGVVCVLVCDSTYACVNTEARRGPHVSCSTVLRLIILRCGLLLNL